MPTAFDTQLDKFLVRLENDRVVKTPQALELEARGPIDWLKTLFPRSFRQPFSSSSIEAWRVMWRVLEKLRQGHKLRVEEYSMMMFFSRGLGKSTHSEAFCIAEGGVVGEGYDLYLSDTDPMAEEHLYNIAELINQGQVEQFYPQLAQPRINELTGEQAEFSKKALITEGNWAVTAKGLRGNVRGSRKGSLRFTLVVGDDMDRLDESQLVVDKKLRNLSRGVLGAGTKKMLFLFAQNVIAEGSMADQILTNKTDVCSERIILCGKPVKAFDELEIKTDVNPDGTIKHELVKFVPHWDYFDIDAAKKFLAQSGKEAFLAEYQHEFDLKKDKVVSRFNRKAQVITWDMFAEKFGSPFIPESWTRRCAADIGYTEKSNSAWAFVATAPENTPLAGKHFMYRGLNFVRASIKEQMLRFWVSMFPDPDTGKNYFEAEINFGLLPVLYRELLQVPRCKDYLETYEYDVEFGLWRHPRHGLEPFFESTFDSFQISHEKSGELMTIHESYGLPVAKIENFGADDGVSQWNDLCEQDHYVRNPFLYDEKVKNEDKDRNEWVLGSPNLFYIVDKSEYEIAKTDLGLKKNLDNVAKWKYVRQNITESGIGEQRPEKMEAGDTVDAERAIYATFGAKPLELTAAEAFERHVAAHHRNLLPARIQQMHPAQRGFAEVERIELEEEFKRGTSRVFVPEGMVNDF